MAYGRKWTSRTQSEANACEAENTTSRAVPTSCSRTERVNRDARSSTEPLLDDHRYLE
jgi:hypothetical protein